MVNSYKGSTEVQKQMGYAPNTAINRALDALLKAGTLRRLEGRYINEEIQNNLLTALSKLLTNFHREQPERDGLAKEVTRQRLKQEEKSWDILVDYWLSAGEITIANGHLALPEHSLQHGDWRQNLADRGGNCPQRY